MPGVTTPGAFHRKIRHHKGSQWQNVQSQHSESSRANSFRVRSLLRQSRSDLKSVSQMTEKAAYTPQKHQVLFLSHEGLVKSLSQLEFSSCLE